MFVILQARPRLPTDLGCGERGWRCRPGARAAPAPAPHLAPGPYYYLCSSSSSSSIVVIGISSISSIIIISSSINSISSISSISSINSISSISSISSIMIMIMIVSSSSSSSSMLVVDIAINCYCMYGWMDVCMRQVLHDPLREHFFGVEFVGS